jgi:hypothetical protein
MGVRLGLTLNEVHGLRVLKIMVLREIIEARRYKVTGDSRRLQNK